MRELLEDGPRHRDALLVLSLALAGRDEWSSAADVARRVTAMDPDRESQEILAWALIAGALDIDEGIRVAELALTLPADPFRENTVLPVVPSAEHALGLAQLRRGEYIAAIKTLEHAAELRPDRESIREDLSEARLKAAG